MMTAKDFLDAMKEFQDKVDTLNRHSKIPEFPNAVYYRRAT